MSTQGQPKWAWWVVGILIPVIGIVVTIWAANRSSDSDDGSGGAAAVGTPRPPAATGPGTTGPAPASPPLSRTPDAPAKVPADPVEITLKPGANYLDLDTAPPMAMPSAKSADLVVLFAVGTPGLVTEGSTPTLAVLPAEGPDPTAAECAEAVDKRGTYQTGDLTRGARFCTESDEGHLAYLRVVSGVAIEAPVRFQVTVWK